MKIELLVGEICAFCNEGKTNPHTGQRRVPYNYVYSITGYSWSARLCKPCLDNIISFKLDCEKVADALVEELGKK